MRKNTVDIEPSERESEKQNYWTFLGNPFLGRHCSVPQALRQAKRSRGRAEQARASAELQLAEVKRLQTEARELDERLDQMFLQARQQKLALKPPTQEENRLILAQIDHLIGLSRDVTAKLELAVAKANPLIEEANQMDARAQQLALWAEEAMSDLSREVSSEDFSFLTLK